MGRWPRQRARPCACQDPLERSGAARVQSSCPADLMSKREEHALQCGLTRSSSRRIMIRASGKPSASTGSRRAGWANGRGKREAGHCGRRCARSPSRACRELVNRRSSSLVIIAKADTGAWTSSSAAVPSHTIRPSRRNVKLVQTRSSSPIWWLESWIVTPSSPRARGRGREARDLPGADRIEAACRLVEQQQLGEQQQRCRNPESLTRRTGRVTTDAVIGPLLQTDTRQRRVNRGPHLAFRRCCSGTVEPGEQAEVHASAQVRVEGRALDEVGHIVECFDAEIQFGFLAEQLDVRRVRPDKSEQHAQQRWSCAAPVQPEQPANLACFDQVHPAERHGCEVRSGLTHSNRAGTATTLQIYG